MQELVSERTQEGYPNPEEDVQDLARLGREAEGWIKVADHLLHKVVKRDAAQAAGDVYKSVSSWSSASDVVSTVSGGAHESASDGEMARRTEQDGLAVTVDKSAPKDVSAVWSCKPYLSHVQWW